ncbi:MAG TPA: hypothetical protein VLK33_16770, partial [Terriglobales bacterium]|nr:hypothetical protein [Terriglobales bacterium]
MKRTLIRSVTAVITAGLLMGLGMGAVAIWKARHVLRSSVAEVKAEHEIAFTTRSFPPIQTDFEVISSPAVFFQAARFQDHLYIAGPAGLLEFDHTGAFLHQYAVGKELPGSSLIALAPAVLSDSHKPELIMATAEDGILAFDGGAFRQILPNDADFRVITVILPSASGHLIIGTKKHGVLVYDGKQMAPLHST